MKKFPDFYELLILHLLSFSPVGVNLTRLQESSRTSMTIIEYSTIKGSNVKEENEQNNEIIQETD